MFTPRSVRAVLRHVLGWLWCGAGVPERRIRDFRGLVSAGCGAPLASSWLSLSPPEPGEDDASDSSELLMVRILRRRRTRLRVSEVRGRASGSRVACIHVGSVHTCMFPSCACVSIAVSLVVGSWESWLRRRADRAEENRKRAVRAAETIAIHAQNAAANADRTRQAGTQRTKQLTLFSIFRDQI